MTETIKGVDVPSVTAWFEANVSGARGPLRFDLIAGGHSNLTYGVTDADDHRYVLRRPPLGHVLATAHDMGREHKIISALGPTDVPVAPALGLCTDDAVNGAPFYVMEYVDGQVLRDGAAAEAISPDARANASRSIADTLAKVHAVDPDAVGLGDLGKKEGYIERQLKRWYGQWGQSKTRELPAIDEVHDALLARIPDQGPAAIVHGDYRLDNCMTDAEGNIIAVLDWEICTLGDPLADLGLLMVYWTEPDDEVAMLLTAPTAIDGFMSRQQVLDRYAEVSGRNLSDIDFYIAFGYWKLACIVEGVYARYVGGALGNDAKGFEGFAIQVERCAAAAAEAVGRLS
ncbi:MAG: phosphotransferase family protein [Acidimicrobiales bacterium]|nr:phosphotransferase family protein [Acidimicrobiales bacterium]